MLCYAYCHGYTETYCYGYCHGYCHGYTETYCYGYCHGIIVMVTQKLTVMVIVMVTDQTLIRTHFFYSKKHMIP